VQEWLIPCALPFHCVVNSHPILLPTSHPPALQAQPVQEWLRAACERAAADDSLDLPDGLTAADWACVREQVSGQLGLAGRSSRASLCNSCGLLGSWVSAARRSLPADYTAMVSG